MTLPIPGSLFKVLLPRYYVFPLQGEGLYWEGRTLKKGDIVMYLRPALDEDLLYANQTAIEQGATYSVVLHGERRFVLNFQDKVGKCPALKQILP